MNNKKIFAVILIGIFVSVVVYFALTQKKESKKTGVAITGKYKKLAELADSNPQEFRTELFKFAQTPDGELEEIIVSFTESKSLVVRSNAVEALGFFSSERSLNLVKDALNDEEKNVRISALRGLSRPIREVNLTDEERDAANEKRSRAVLEFLQREDLATSEKIELYTSLARTGNEKNSDLAIEWLVYFSQQGNEYSNNTALFRAAAANPENIKLIEELHKILKESKDEEVDKVAFAIRHLAAIKDPIVEDNYKAWMKSKNSEIRSAAIYSLPFACPKGFWKAMVERVKNEKDLRVWGAILDMPKQMLGNKSRLFLKNLLKQNRVPQSLVEKAKSNLQFVRENQKNIRCENE